MFKKSKVIDAKKPLSKSLLWKFQTDYFDSLGVEAWKQAVPFYVTSNPYIANSYAQTAVNFIRDYLNKHPESKKHPFYIVELGTGSGCFSFYALKYINQMRNELNMTDVDICYVMTDFTEKNLEFWRSQEELSKYVKQGLLDFAVFNMEYDTELHLTESNKTLKRQEVENPITVFANYIFDTVSHDCFHIKDGQLSEALISLRADNKDYVDGKLNSFDSLKTEFTTKNISDNYYEDENFNQVLQYFKNNIKNSYMLFPLAGLQTIKNLLKLNDKMLLVSSDKAYSSLEQLDNLGEPGIVFHGSFSLMVNYAAINEYFKCIDGDAILQVPRPGLDTFVGLAGMKLDELPSLKCTANQYVNELSPSHYFTLYRFVNDHLDSYDVKTLASHLCFTLWDPHVFKRAVRIICKQADKTDQLILNYLISNVDKIADNFYFMPGCHDILFDIGLFLYCVKQYEKALYYFDQSEKYFGDKFNLRYNAALCHYYLKDYDKSLRDFEKSLTYNSSSSSSKDWIKYIKKNHA